MRCLRCHQALPTDARFCPFCGAESAVAAAQAVTYSGPTREVCRGCGVQRASELSECGVCHQQYAEGVVPAPLLDGTRYWVGLRAWFTCGPCGQLSPINHLDVDGRVLCLHCGNEQRFDTDQWWLALKHAHATGDLAGPEAEGRFPNAEVSIAEVNELRWVGVGLPWSEWMQTEVELNATHNSSLLVHAAPGHPLSGQSRLPLEVVSVSGSELRTRCPASHTEKVFSMSATVSVRSGVLGVVGDEHARDCSPATLESHGEGSILAKCAHCGAPLEVSGKSSVVTCGHCHSSSFIAHQTLRQLGHINPEPLVWWVLFDGPSSRRRKYEREAKRARR